MAEPSEAAKRKAQELFDSALHLSSITILARYIQTTSDVAKQWRASTEWAGTVHYPKIEIARQALLSLILPDEPDPLNDMREVLREMTGTFPPPDKPWPDGLISEVTKRLAARGKRLKIVEASDD